ncbi:MAG: GNAT family N-acetyltransferase [Spirochaetota bacterium]|nr:GNAT family N-acetyltransferase [Spirochaetota bacterium]
MLKDEKKNSQSKFNIRAAIPTDLESIYNIIKPYADEQIILERSENDILLNLDKFIIAQHEDEIVGVVSYYDYGNELKEIRSLAVKKNRNKRGVGSLLLNTIVKFLLNNFPDAKIFVLTYSPIFFKKNDFICIPRDSLPEKIWKDCQNCKNKDNCNEIALMFSNT